MRYIFAFVLCAAALCVRSQAWFDHVRRPSALGHEKMEKLAFDLRGALKRNEPLDKIAKLAPQEAMPRVVFITIGGDKWPGRTYFGTGVNFQTAFRTAVDFLLSTEPVFARETLKLAKSRIETAARDKTPISSEWHERIKNPSEWDWLRMDVVQFVQNVPEFSIQRSHIAMTSLCGMAFPPSMGFAFTPEQLTARYMLNDNRTLDTGQICNIISEAYNWGALKVWMNVSADEARVFPISLFETDSYYADGSGAVRLYRGHRLEYDVPSPERCIEMASACAASLGKMITAEGKVNAPFPVWYSSGYKGTEENDACLETAIALFRLYAVTKDPATGRTACALMRPVIRILVPFGEGKKGLAVRENEPLPENAVQVPRHITTVRTNGLMSIALKAMHDCGLDYTGQEGRPEPDVIAGRIADYLAAQVENDGLVLDSRFVPSGKLFTDDDTFASIEDAAIVALAIGERHKEKAVRILESIMEKCERQPLETLSVSPWIAEALMHKGTVDRTFLMKAMRLAYAAEMSDTSPLYPDLYGAVRSRPGCTYSALRTWTSTAMASWLRKIEKFGLASERVRNVRPMVVFHSQAFIDKPAASALPSPALYTGFFRDNLEDYGFNLRGQAAQITALVKFAEEMKALDFPPPKLNIRAARAASDVHPGILQVVPVFTQSGMKNAVSRDFMGTFSGVKQSTRKVQMPKQTRNK